MQENMAKNLLKILEFLLIYLKYKSKQFLTLKRFLKAEVINGR